MRGVVQTFITLICLCVGVEVCKCVRLCMCMCTYKREGGSKRESKGEREVGRRARAVPSIRLVQTLGKQTSTFLFTMSLTLRSPAVPPGCCPLTHRIGNIALSILARQRWTACVPINALTLYVCS